MDEATVIRQSERDAEYIAACREHGIEPDLPEYKILSNHASEPTEVTSAQLDDYGVRNNGARLVRVPLTAIEARELEAEEAAKVPEEDKVMREAMGRVLEIILVGASPNCRAKLAERARASGLRVLTMAWMVGRGPMAALSLTEMAKDLGCTRATLSWHARQLERATGFHARGQKLSSNVANYKAARVRYLERCKAAGVTPATSLRKISRSEQIEESDG